MALSILISPPPYRHILLRVSPVAANQSGPLSRLQPIVLHCNNTYSCSIVITIQWLLDCLLSFVCSDFYIVLSIFVDLLLFSFSFQLLLKSFLWLLLKAFAIGWWKFLNPLKEYNRGSLRYKKVLRISSEVQWMLIFWRWILSILHFKAAHCQLFSWKIGAVFVAKLFVTDKVNTVCISCNW